MVSRLVDASLFLGNGGAYALEAANKEIEHNNELDELRVLIGQLDKRILAGRGLYDKQAEKEIKIKNELKELRGQIHELKKVVPVTRERSEDEAVVEIQFEKERIESVGHRNGDSSGSDSDSSDEEAPRIIKVISERTESRDKIREVKPVVTSDYTILSELEDLRRKVIKVRKDAAKVSDEDEKLVRQVDSLAILQRNLTIDLDL
jgi:hypothetical protein